MALIKSKILNLFPSPKEREGAPMVRRVRFVS